MNYLPENKSISPDYKFVWGDEFDGNELDLNTWNFRTYFWGKKSPTFSEDAPP